VEDDESDGELVKEGEDVEDTSDARHFDINKTPKTPPRTPTTASLPTSDSGFSIALFPNSWVQLRAGSTMTTVLLTLGLGVVFVFLLLLAFVGSKVVKARICETMDSIAMMLVVASDTAEMGIEGTGWIIGRAVGRFGRGFQRGYRV
jgi:hypothetical protein